MNLKQMSHIPIIIIGILLIAIGITRIIQESKKEDKPIELKVEEPEHGDMRTRELSGKIWVEQYQAFPGWCMLRPYETEEDAKDYIRTFNEVRKRRDESIFNGTAYPPSEPLTLKKTENEPSLASRIEAMGKMWEEERKATREHNQKYTEHLATLIIGLMRELKKETFEVDNKWPNDVYLSITTPFKEEAEKIKVTLKPLSSPHTFTIDPDKAKKEVDKAQAFWKETTDSKLDIKEPIMPTEDVKKGHNAQVFTDSTNYHEKVLPYQKMVDPKKDNK